MKIVQSILTKNPCYKASKKLAVKGLMLHSVGCPQPKASVFIGQFNSASYTRACVHGFIDGNDGTVYQTLPWDMRGWHAGGKANDTHIGIEMCEPACIKYTGGSTFTISNKTEAKAVAKRTYESAVQLFAKLCRDYKLDPMKDGVIISHTEGHKRGVASDHGDPEHFWKGVGVSYTMNGFRKDVAEAMGKSTTSTTKTPTVSNQNATAYLVKVKATTLNVRAGAGTDFNIATVVQKGEVFTIVEEKNGWGRLKSGAGWICLKYTTKM